MSLRKRWSIVLIALLAPMLLTSTAAAQAGAACSGTVCGLGGQIRHQINALLPLPISLAPGQEASGSQATVGPFTAITIQTAPANAFGVAFPFALPFVGQGLGQTGQIKPTPSATIMQTLNPGTGPRQLTMSPGIFHYAGQASLGIVHIDFKRFAIQTNGVHDFPHPGTTASGAPAFTQANKTVAIPTPNANVLFAGGRIGAPTVTFYVDATASGSPTNNYGHGVPPNFTVNALAGNAGSPPINGFVRFTATGNQFGGQAVGRRSGTTKYYYNGAPFLDPVADLPCKVTATPAEGTTARGFFVPFNIGTECQFSLSIVDPVGSDTTAGIAGGRFNGLSIRSAFVTNTGVFTGTIGFNGTILGQGAPVTAAGIGIPINIRGRRAVGFPMTTGRVTISVTSNLVTSSMFIRTGTDARDAAGNGVVALVTGSMSFRDVSFGSADRTWITLEIPEPNAILAASAGLFALFACHRLAGRRT